VKKQFKSKGILPKRVYKQRPRRFAHGLAGFHMAGTKTHFRKLRMYNPHLSRTAFLRQYGPGGFDGGSYYG